MTTGHDRVSMAFLLDEADRCVAPLVETLNAIDEGHLELIGYAEGACAVLENADETTKTDDGDGDEDGFDELPNNDFYTMIRAESDVSSADSMTASMDLTKVLIDGDGRDDRHSGAAENVTAEAPPTKSDDLMNDDDRSLYSFYPDGSSEMMFTSNKLFDCDDVDQAREEIQARAGVFRQKQKLYQSMQERAVRTRLQASLEAEAELEAQLAASEERERELNRDYQWEAVLEARRKKIEEAKTSVQKCRQDLDELQAQFEANKVRIEVLTEERNDAATVALELDLLAALSGVYPEDLENVLEDLANYQVMVSKLRNYLNNDEVEVLTGKDAEAAGNKAAMVEGQITELSMLLTEVEAENAAIEHTMITLGLTLAELQMEKDEQEHRISTLRQHIVSTFFSFQPSMETPKAQNSGPVVFRNWEVGQLRDVSSKAA